MEGIVTKSTGSWYTVCTKTGEKIECRLKGKFRIKGIKSTNPVTVGDHVKFEFEDSKNTGVINKIFDRKNYIIRKSVNLSKQTHIIAANIDVAFLLVTIDNPPTFAGFIDRFLATTEAYAIKAILLFNKVDVNDEATQKSLPNSSRNLSQKSKRFLRLYKTSSAIPGWGFSFPQCCFPSLSQVFTSGPDLLR